MLDKLFRILFGFVGCAIIGATAYVTIRSNGGFDAPQAPLTIAVACGVAIGSIAFAWACAARRWGFILAFAIALFAGEAAGIAATGERVLNSRDAAAEPVRLATIKRKLAQQRLDAALAVHITTSPRLDAALEAKRAADASVASEASKKTCVSNCRALLNKAVDDAAAEMTAARVDMEDQQRAAAREVDAAKAALDALPAPKSETLLADKLQMNGATLDLILAALTSLGANGLGAILLAWAVHGGHHKEQRREQRSTAPWRLAEPVVTLPRLSASQFASNDRRPVLALPATPDEHVARFGLDNLKAAKKGRIALADITGAYIDWCADQQLPPLPMRDITPAMAKLFSETPGISYEEADNGDLYITGVKLLRERPTRERTLTPIPDKNARLAG